MDKAKNALHQAPEHERTTVAMELLPDSVQWATAIKPFLMVTPNPAFALTSPLGSAVNMVNRTSEATEPPSLAQLPHDSDGYSAAVRMAWYTTSIIEATDIFDSISPEQRSEIHENLTLAAHLADDNLSLAGANHLWVIHGPEVEAKMLEFISSTQSLVRKWLDASRSGDKSPSGRDFIDNTLEKFSKNSLGTSAFAYYYARALSVVNSQLVELQGHSKLSASMRWNGTARDLRKSKGGNQRLLKAI